MRVELAWIVALTMLVGAVDTVASPQGEDTPPDVVFELMSSREESFEVFLFSSNDGGDTHFYGGASHDAEAATLVFLGSVGRNQLVSGGLVSSASVPGALLGWWTDGHCHFTADFLADSREVVQANIAQLIRRDGFEELLLGLSRLSTMANPHPVIQRNLVPFFTGLVPKRPREEEVSVVWAADARLLRILWDQVEARYWQAVAEMSATDELLATWHAVEIPPPRDR